MCVRRLITYSHISINLLGAATYLAPRLIPQCKFYSRITYSCDSVGLGVVFKHLCSPFKPPLCLRYTVASHHFVISRFFIYSPQKLENDYYFLTEKSTELQTWPKVQRTLQDGFLRFVVNLLPGFQGDAVYWFRGARNTLFLGLLHSCLPHPSWGRMFIRICLPEADKHSFFPAPRSIFLCISSFILVA